MLTRIITSIVALAVFAAILMTGSKLLFLIAVAVVTADMLYEMYSVIKNHIVLKILGYISAAFIFFCAADIIPKSDSLPLSEISVTAALALFMAASVFLHKKADFSQTAKTYMTTLFITLFMTAILNTYYRFGVSAMMLIFISAWSTDTFAYFAGRAFGRHKLIPNVSPKKTVEGAIGGIIGCIVCNLIYIAVVEKFFGITVLENIGILPKAAFALCTSVLGQIGDLCASVVKRDHGAKDYGFIFPGHGGFMDRFDSVIFIAPFVLYVCTLLGM